MVSEEDNIVSLPHFIDDRSNRYWEYSDSCVHVECFLEWPEAKEFRRMFDEHAMNFQPRFPKTMRRDGSVVDDPNLESQSSFF